MMASCTTDTETTDSVASEISDLVADLNERKCSDQNSDVLASTKNNSEDTDSKIHNENSNANIAASVNEPEMDKIFIKAENQTDQDVDENKIPCQDISNPSGLPISNGAVKENRVSSTSSNDSSNILNSKDPPAFTDDQNRVFNVDKSSSTKISELSSLMEHPTKDAILSLIPSKIQQGFRTINVRITCMDASDTHLLFGSNAGCGFLINRKTGGITKVLSESRTDVISSVKLFIGIEMQVALGTEDGKITIVIISQFSTDSAKQVNKFSLGNIHSFEVTCMEWSINGMKLFSGDSKGGIYCMERDFEKNNCSVSLEHKEAHSIVDLSYKHMILLISTTERSLLLHTNGNEVKLIGSKPRQGRYGSCFNSDSISTSDLKVYSARPGYRIWIADVEGQVTNTLVLKDLIQSFNSNIQLNTEEQGAMIHQDLQFRKLSIFQGRYVLAYSETTVFLIDPSKPGIVAGNKEVREILSIVTTTDEIFILCKNRKLHRVAQKPDDLANQRKRLMEDKKTEPNKNLMEVKDSLTEIKKNFTPLVDRLQSGMSSLNEGAGHWSQKLQSQAKSFQMKLPRSLFNRESKNSQQPDHLEAVAEKPKSSDTASDEAEVESKSSGKSEVPASVNNMEEENKSLPEPDEENPAKNKECIVMSLYETTNSNSNALKEIFDNKANSQDFLHSQGNTLLKELIQPPSKPVEFHFDKLNKIPTDDDGGEIVFASKRKKKSRSASGSKGSKRDSDLSNNIFHHHDEKLTTSDLHSSKVDINCEIMEENAKTEVRGGSVTMANVRAQSSSVSEDCSLTMDDIMDFKVLSPESTNSFKLESQKVKGDSEVKGEFNLRISDDSQEVKDEPEINSDRSICSGVKNDFLEVENEAFEGLVDEVEGDPSETSNLADDEKLILVMQKTTGNQICPKVIKTPVVTDDIGFDFSLSDQLHLPVEVDTAVSASEIQPESVSGEVTTTTYNNVVNAPELYSKSGNTGVKTIKIQEADIASRSVEMKKPSDRKPLFCDSGSENSVDDEIVGSIDDIYAVDEGKRDFESEIDSDSEDSADEIEEPKLHKQISEASSTNSFTNYETGVPAKLLDCWSATKLPHHVISLGGSGSYVWYIDYFNDVYITEETDMWNNRWSKFAKKGRQLSISPSGSVAWLISKSGKLYAAVMPVEFQEVIKLNWQLVGNGESVITLGHNSAWAVSNSGNVKVQFGISQSHLFTKSWDLIPWDNEKITHITSTKSAIWCRTEPGNIFSAKLSDIDATDFQWEKIDSALSDDNSSTIQSITSDGRNVLFGVDSKGILWFLNEDRKWWQVNVSEYVDEDRHLVSRSQMHAFPTSVSESVQKVQRWMAGLVRVQHVAISNRSIWIIHDKQKASVARGPVTGHKWDVTLPLDVIKSAKWKHITTSSVFSPEHGAWIGLVWASRPNDEIFCFPSEDVSTVHPVTLAPPLRTKASVVCMSACKEALWVLYSDGIIYIRSGISAECLKGTEWSKLDTSEQLGPVKLVHVSCGTQNVWAIDSKGNVYFRIGVTATDRHSLPHAWIPIDGLEGTPGSYFTQIECGLSDGSIWALDNFSNVYVRTGVTYDMSAGEAWEQVPGSHAQQICISNHTVWGLRTGGNIIKRYGISDKNVMGDYWKKLKGNFKKIAATPYDELWAIDNDQRLRHHYTSTFCPLVVEAQYQENSTNGVAFEDPLQEWEFL